jgi:hypothetical protein
MKPFVLILIVSMAPLGLVAAEPVSDLLTPKKRAETLILARSLLTIKALDSSEEALAAMNPFNPFQPSAPNAEAERGPDQSAVPVVMSDRDLLKKLADEVNPSGMMQMGENIFLLVGKKRLKVGDRLAVNSGGVAYDVEISFINRTSFTLRIKNEELTRPIKALVKKP